MVMVVMVMPMMMVVITVVMVFTAAMLMMVVVMAAAAMLMVVVVMAAATMLMVVVVMATIAMFMYMFLPGKDGHLGFYLFRSQQNLRQQPIRILRCNSKLSGSKCQDSILYARDLLDFTFHLSGAVGAIQIFHQIGLRHKTLLVISTYEQLFMCLVHYNPVSPSCQEKTGVI
jgi:hypothetical protein